MFDMRPLMFVAVKFPHYRTIRVSRAIYTVPWKGSTTVTAMSTQAGRMELPETSRCGRPTRATATCLGVDVPKREVGGVLILLRRRLRPQNQNMTAPEVAARHNIDKMLERSGWIVQDYKSLNLGADMGIAVREYPLGREACDYALFIDRQPVGVVEAKPEGWTLLGVTPQSDRYLEGLSDKFPHAPRKPPFSYETTGVQTIFADRRDPDYRSRDVFTFHTPRAMARWLAEEKTMRSRLEKIPELDYSNLWSCQFQAVKNLEKSLSENRQRALIQMATGSGKTFTAVTFIYRLIEYAGARRILFLVDRHNLGRQALSEFTRYDAPNDGRKFTDLYNVQHLQGQSINRTSKVVISTVQRMYSILKGEKEFDETDEEFSQFSQSDDSDPVVIEYNPDIPIDQFDFIVIDECHRSIYNKWKQVLDYFDSFLIGLTATPSKNTVGFFENNQVMAYTHERAVADGVNVGYHVYKIRTQITQDGAKIDAGEVVEKRDKLTREQWQERLDTDIIYPPSRLDRDVVATDQIRLVIKTFKDRHREIFPGREVVPKTLIFAKDDSHAEDITRITREVFGMGNEFCQKITYKTTGDKPENILASFRNSYSPRIAVTVDMIATGTDIRPLECIIFMRDVKSKLYFDQMKGRGSRVIKPGDLVAVTPDARSKNHYVIIDAVGVCEHSMSGMYSLRKTNASFKELMRAVSEGRAGEDVVSSLADRLARLDRSLDKKAKDEIEVVSGGITISQMVNKLLDGIDTDMQVRYAKEKFLTDFPTDGQIKQASKDIIKDACSIFDNAQLRQTILDVKSRREMVIDSNSIDKLIAAGFDREANDASKRVREDFEGFMTKKKAELVALEILYSKPYRIRDLTFEDIKELASKIEEPPLRMDTRLLWSAYKRLEKSKTKDNPQATLTDLISIVRFALGREKVLIPFGEKVNTKFQNWLTEQTSTGRRFTQEQINWLVMIKDHIATSIVATIEDMDDVPFSQKGGRIKFYDLFGDQYEQLFDELHQELITQ